MEYTVEDIIKDLNSDKAWNEIREQMIASGLNKKVMDDSTKKELSEAVNQYFYRKCPQEYKDNPHIHYEVRMKKRYHQSVNGRWYFYTLLSADQT